MSMVGWSGRPRCHLGLIRSMEIEGGSSCPLGFLVATPRWLSCTAGIEIDRTLKLTLIDIGRNLIDSVTELFPRQMRRHRHTRQTIRHIRNTRHIRPIRHIRNMRHTDTTCYHWICSKLADIVRFFYATKIRRDGQSKSVLDIFQQTGSRETLALSKVTEKSRVHQWCTFHFIVISSGTRPLVRLQNWSQPSYGWKLCPNFILRCIVRTRWELH